MIKGGAVDPALMKELRIALDTIGRSVGTSDPALAEDIDDVADAIAMQNEYGLGVPLTSDLRKQSPVQQGALQARQLDASQKFIEERLEDSDGRGTRSEGMRFVIAAGVYKAHQAFDELERFRTFYTQRALSLLTSLRISLSTNPFKQSWLQPFYSPAKPSEKNHLFSFDDCQLSR